MRKKRSTFAYILRLTKANYSSQGIINMSAFHKNIFTNINPLCYNQKYFINC